MKDESGTSSSRAPSSWRGSSRSRMDSAAPSTTPARPSDRPTRAKLPTLLAQELFGSTSMQAGTRKNRSGKSTSMLPKLRKQSVLLSDGLYSHHQFTLARVTVSIAIGRWKKFWMFGSGVDMPPGYNVLHISTAWKWTRLELRIWRAYFELPALTTEKVHPSSSRSET